MLGEAVRAHLGIGNNDGNGCWSAEQLVVLSGPDGSGYDSQQLQDKLLEEVREKVGQRLLMAYWLIQNGCEHSRTEEGPQVFNYTFYRRCTQELIRIQFQKELKGSVREETRGILTCGISRMTVLI